MLLLKYLLLSICWGPLAWAAVIALNSLYKVVQYHLRMRIHIAPEPGPPTRAALVGVENALPAKPQLYWTTAKWAFPGAWLPLFPAIGMVVVSSGMGGNRVSQTSGRCSGTVNNAQPLRSFVRYNLANRQ